MSDEVHAVQTRVVEHLALNAPRLAEHLRPLQSRVDLDFEISGRQCLRATVARRRPGRPARARRRQRPERADHPAQRLALSLAVEHLLAVVRDLEEAHASQRRVGAPLLQIESVHGQAGARRAGRGQWRFKCQQRARLSRLQRRVLRAAASAARARAAGCCRSRSSPSPSRRCAGCRRAPARFAGPAPAAGFAPSLLLASGAASSSLCGDSGEGSSLSSTIR